MPQKIVKINTPFYSALFGINDLYKPTRKSTKRKLSFYIRRDEEHAMEDRWLTVDEICKYLSVSNETVYKWIDQQGMPGHRVGRRWMFKQDEVDDWVKSGSAMMPSQRKDHAPN